jgi:hypothetical protein
MTVCVRFGRTVSEYSRSDTIELKRGQTQAVPFSFPAFSPPNLDFPSFHKLTTIIVKRSL